MACNLPHAREGDPNEKAWPKWVTRVLNGDQDT